MKSTRFEFESEHYEDGRVTLTLPLPAMACTPNARRGQSVGAAIRKSRIIKQHRAAAYAAAASALAGHGLSAAAFPGYSLAFFWRTAAFRDDDNADAGCKAYRDGIAAALGMDDRNLRKLALSTHAKDALRPRVEITLYPVTHPTP